MDSFNDKSDTLPSFDFNHALLLDHTNSKVSWMTLVQVYYKVSDFILIIGHY
jgi:hypothetical protein